MALAALATLIVLSWLYLFHEAGKMQDITPEMAMPSMQTWGAADLLAVFVMWSIMMIAMMLPSAAPMILWFSKVNQHRQDNPHACTAMFVAGYVAVWAGFSVLATLAQWGLHAAALQSPLAATAPASAGMLLILAGVYQYMPLKKACLVYCRSPLSFLMTRWRPGLAGAFSMGVSHGIYCLGCCWLLMALLFVLGVMNLLWVAALALLVLLEKVVPGGLWIARGAGLLLIGWGAVLIAGSSIF